MEPAEPVIRTGSPSFPEAAVGLRRSAFDEIDAAVAGLSTARFEWARSSAATRAELVAAIRKRLDGAGEEWVRLAIQEKRLRPGTFQESEEWIFLALALRLLRLLERTLRETAEHGKPVLPASARTNSVGRTVQPVFPSEWQDGLAYRGIGGEVWMEDGIEPAEVADLQGGHYLEPASSGTTTLILGAGNLGILAIGDALAKLFIERHVVLLKLNPVNAYVGELMESVFEPVVAVGVMRIVYGGAAEGTRLIEHPQVDTVHMTGSDKTYEQIVFGLGSDGERRKAEGVPVMSKPFTAELGNVSPVIVVPGTWSDVEIDLYGARLATWLSFNAGFVCVTPRVIITSQHWPQRDALLSSINRYLSLIPSRHAYYPGARERHDAFLSNHPDVVRHGSFDEERTPWAVVEGLDPTDHSEPLYRSEAFCSIMAETPLPGASPEEFLAEATRFANDTLWGTLVATIVVSDRQTRDVVMSRTLQRAVCDLRYGAVVTNIFAGIGYGFGQFPVGGFPGSPPNDIQSGTGFVHNYLLLNGVEKAVLTAPFRPRFDPLVATTTRPDFGRLLAAYEHDPSLGNLTKLGWAAARSRRRRR